MNFDYLGQPTDVWAENGQNQLKWTEKNARKMSFSSVQFGQ
jgi:hypothetical protein